MSTIHKYKNNGYNIVLDINSGAVHVVDDAVYEILDVAESLYETIGRFSVMNLLAAISLECQKPGGAQRFSGLSHQELTEAAEEIAELVSEELLFSKDTYKDSLVDYRKRQTVVKALCLLIANDCNLACKYCFAQEGE